LSHCAIGKLYHYRIFNRPIGNHTIAQLFNFLMRRVLAATAAEFLKFQPLGRRFAILRGRVIPLFALTTL
jgi:hypothetical protein